MGEVKEKSPAQALGGNRRFKVKLWHKILLAIGILMLIGGALGLLFPNLYSGILKVFDNPRYAPGEAIAMTQRVYQWQDSGYFVNRYAPLSEEYLGQGIWEVKASGGWVIFKVYEETDTVQIYNTTARNILNRREELDTDKRQPLPPSTPRTTEPKAPTSSSGGLGENPFE